jgi:hypothetical protein
VRYSTVCTAPVDPLEPQRAAAREAGLRPRLCALPACATLHRALDSRATALSSTFSLLDQPSATFRSRRGLLPLLDMDRVSDADVPDQISDEMLELFHQMDALLESDKVNDQTAPAVGETASIDQFPDWDEYLSLLASDNAFVLSLDMKNTMQREIVHL